MNMKTLAGVTLAASLAFASAARADITIGLVAPLTGPVAAYGDQVKNGAQAAVDAINEKGGILGEKIVLKLADDAGDPKQGVSAANLLVGEGVQYVVGPVTSGVAIPASDVFAENGILMVTPTATAPDLTTRGLTNVLRTCGRDDQQAEVAAAYVLKTMKDKRVAVIHDKGTYGKGLADAFRAAINAGGLQEVQYNALTPGEKDLSALITRLKADNVDVIYFGGYHPEGGLLARQLHDGGVKAVIIGGEGLSNTEYWAIANDAAAGTTVYQCHRRAEERGFRRCREDPEGQGHSAGSLHAQRLRGGRSAEGRHREGRQGRRHGSGCRSPQVGRADRHRHRQPDLWRKRRPDLAELLAVQVGRMARSSRPSKPG